jgi:hypothetical protein
LAAIGVPNRAQLAGMEVNFERSEPNAACKIVLHGSLGVLTIENENFAISSFTALKSVYFGRGNPNHPKITASAFTFSGDAGTNGLSPIPRSVSELTAGIGALANQEQVPPSSEDSKLTGPSTGSEKPPGGREVIDV